MWPGVWGRGPGQSLETQCPRPFSAVSPDTFATYLFEAGPALAEAQAGAGVCLDHHLPVLLGLGRVVEPSPHGVAPVSQGAMAGVGWGGVLWSGASRATSSRSTPISD